ncbi:MAG: peptidyl-prolyl cis-trans isomerase [Arcobacteraceae bacterium]|nr:peptidyl-prolyl cis-trans isomerase [Arcobacteraceae bacterium]
MKKYLIIFIMSLSIAQSGLINAIALTVNNEPITLYDIDEKMLKFNLSEAKAVSLLVDEILYKQSLKKYNISVDYFDIDNYIEKLAKNNNMSLYQFKNAVKQQQDYNSFKEQIKNQLKHQKLISKIASNKLSRATTEDIEIYYNNNRSEFMVSNKIDMIQYSSTNKKALQSIQKNPMMIDSDVSVNNITLTQDTMDAQMKFIVNKTVEQSFSAIFASNKTYNMLFISKKDEIKTIVIEEVKDKIFGIIMTQREKEYLKDYFETLKIIADIKVLR